MNRWISTIVWLVCAALVVAAAAVANHLAHAQRPGGGGARSRLATSDTRQYAEAGLELPPPGGSGACYAFPPRQFPAATPAQQAAAGNQVVARSLAQALDQAAASGNAKAVDDLVNGLSKYGATARDAVQEEIGRTKSPKAKEALQRALDRLNS